MATYGPKPTSAPTGAIILNPGDNVSAVVNAAPAGATFYFEPGVYRGVSLWPKDGQTFIGAEGATLNGSGVLTNWTQSGNLWVVGGQTQEGPVFSGATYVPGTERAGYPETVFIDNTPLKAVDALSKVVPGTFYFDYAADKIYIGDNPAGHTVEAGKLTDAFRGNATNVTVQNFVIEKYGPQIQEGAINGGQNWTIKDNEVRLNYAVGITAHDGNQIIGNYVHDNGQMGLSGSGNNVLVQGNELASNGFWSGIDPYWSAGGLKFGETDNLVVRGNYSHDNNGSGMWTDINNIHTLYEDNVVAHNTINGIQHEISYDAIIRNNTLVGNAYADKRGWGWGAEIGIQNSQNVQAYGNHVDMTGGNNGIILIQQDRGSGTYGPWVTTGNQIHDNVVVDRDPAQIDPGSGNSHGANGGFADYNQSGMLNGGNTWSNNQYFMSDAPGRFQWVYNKTFPQFQAATGETGSISQSYPDTSGWLTTAGGAMATPTVIATGDLTGVTPSAPMGLTTSDPTSAATALTTGDPAGVTAAASTGDPTGVAPAVTTGDPTGGTTAVTTGDPTSVTTAATTGDLTGVTTGVTTGDPTGVAPAVTTGDPTGIAPTANDQLTGTQATAASSNDGLNGGPVNNTLNGAAGADLTTGGGSNATVGNAGDPVIAATGGGTDVVNPPVNSTPGAGQAVETLPAAGMGDLPLTDNDLANHLVGGADGDTLNGGGGNDRFAFHRRCGRDAGQDFRPDSDHHDVSTRHMHNLNSLMASAFDSGGSTTIAPSSTDTSELTGAHLSQLNPGGFSR